MIRKILLLFVLGLLSFVAKAQFYPLEAGARGGYSSGVNFRAYIEESLSYEALASFRRNGVQLHMFRQQHTEVYMARSGILYLVYGAGAHLGYYHSDHYKILFQDIYFGKRVFSPVLGIDGYAGLEYRLDDMPFSVGITFKPYMELSLRQLFGINIWDVGFTVKYRFGNTFYQ